TLTESWLGEPLCILFGQLVFPRLIARSFPKGGAMICVSRAPGWHRESDAAALWDEEDLTGKERFWQLYGDLMLFIAKAGEFERHKLTSLYEELIQASRGSRWVWAMTFASSIEGVIRMLAPRGSKRAEVDHASSASINERIKGWHDPQRPKQSVECLNIIDSNAHH